MSPSEAPTPIVSGNRKSCSFLYDTVQLTVLIGLNMHFVLGRGVNADNVANAVATMLLKPHI